MPLFRFIRLIDSFAAVIYIHVNRQQRITDRTDTLPSAGFILMPCATARFFFLPAFAAAFFFHVAVYKRYAHADTFACRLRRFRCLHTLALIFDGRHVASAAALQTVCCRRHACYFADDDCRLC